MTKNIINSVMNIITETFSMDNISKLLKSDSKFSKFLGIGLLIV
jgi:hypothetical protein